ncbi:putative esterase [Lotmaria passim]
MAYNEAIHLQALSHNPVNSDHSKFCMQFDNITYQKGKEGVFYDGDEGGTVHITLAFPSAACVTVWTPEVQVPLHRSPVEPDLWTVTAQFPIGYRYVYILVDGKDVLVPYLPIGFGYCRPVNYIDVPPPDAKSCVYAMRPHVERGTVAHDYFDSTRTNAVEKLLVYLPPSYHKFGSATRRYPVLYLQHGLGENENGWVYAGKVNIIADNLIADGKMTEMIIVMGSGTIFENGAVNPKAYCAELVEDIIPFIDNRYRTKADRDNRAIAGLSMGSMQASRLSITRPDLFAYVGIFSGFLRLLLSNADVENDDHMEVLRRDPAAYQCAMKVFFRCMGDEDVHMPRFEEDDAILAELGVQCTRRIYKGPHSWHVWRQAAPDFLTMIFK